MPWLCFSDVDVPIPAAIPGYGAARPAVDRAVHVTSTLARLQASGASKGLSAASITLREQQLRELQTEREHMLSLIRGPVTLDTTALSAQDGTPLWSDDENIDQDVCQ